MGTSISIPFVVMSFAFLYLMLINWGSYMPIHIYFCKKPFLYLLQQSTVAHIWFTKKQCQITIQIYWNKELLSGFQLYCITAGTRISFLEKQNGRLTRDLPGTCNYSAVPRKWFSITYLTYPHGHTYWLGHTEQAYPCNKRHFIGTRSLEA